MNSSKVQNQIDSYAQNKYKYGFETEIELERAEKGLNENTIKYISSKKNEPKWLLEWRLKSFEKWKTMNTPSWANIDFPEDIPPAAIRGKLMFLAIKGIKQKLVVSSLPL